MPGSKASSPVETPRVDFQFLNFSHPSEAKTSQHRKQVRSHVTKQQHQREHALNAARRAQSYQAEEAVDKSPIQRSHAATFPSEQPASTELPGGSGSKPGSPKSLSQASSPGASPTASSPQSGVDLTSLYPEQWQPYVPRIMVSVGYGMIERSNDLTAVTGSVLAKHGHRHTRHGCIGVTAAASIKILLLRACQLCTTTCGAAHGNFTLQPHVWLEIARHQPVAAARNGNLRDQQCVSRRGSWHQRSSHRSCCTDGSIRSTLR